PPATPYANSRSCAPNPRTAPVAWNTPSIKGRNAGFRPDWSVASKPQLQGACRAVLDRAAKKAPLGRGLGLGESSNSTVAACHLGAALLWRTRRTARWDKARCEGHRGRII